MQTFERDSVDSESEQPQATNVSGLSSLQIALRYIKTSQPTLSIACLGWLHASGCSLSRCGSTLPAVAFHDRQYSSRGGRAGPPRHAPGYVATVQVEDIWESKVSTIFIADDGPVHAEACPYRSVRAMSGYGTAPSSLAVVYGWLQCSVPYVYLSWCPCTCVLESN